jgi:hypothetical protein
VLVCRCATRSHLGSMARGVEDERAKRYDPTNGNSATTWKIFWQRLAKVFKKTVISDQLYFDCAERAVKFV